MQEFVSIGKIGKAHGIKGAMKLLAVEAYLPDLESASAIFIEENGQKLPYFLEEVQIGNATILTLEEVGTKEAANRLKSREVFLRESDLLPIENRAFNSLQYEQYKGFELEDKELGTIGVIEEIIEMPQQEMAVVNYQDKEVLIPLNEDFILETLKEEKLIKVTLPEGLLDLY
ncbi:MAG: ribosome maturation factor RimM [Bacteroidota bacterium]